MAENPYSLPISRDENPNSNSNPIYVQETGAVETITKIISKASNTVTGNNTVVNQDYTAVGTQFRLKGVIAASLGRFKVEIKSGPLATLVSRAVLYVNTAENNAYVPFPVSVDIVTGDLIRLVITHLQTGADDIHSTIVGEEVA